MLSHSAALVSLQASGTVRQDAPHEGRGDAHEMRAVLPIGTRLIHQLQVSYIDQSGGLQGVALALLAHQVVRDAAQFVFHEGNQLVETVLFARTPAEQQTRDRGRIRLTHFHGA
jgi:hypothetical protein